MFDFLRHKGEKQAVRHYAIVMAFAVVALVGLGLISVLFKTTVLQYYASSGDNSAEEVVRESPFARSLPVRLHIPKINIDAEFVPPLDLNDDQTVSVPDVYDKVGWYKYGATPGEIGAAVILGHVDSLTGPAVFFSLGQLREGDEIEVTRADGTTAVFVVDELKRYNQQEFPTEKVYGKINHAGLRLVTCTGLFDKGVQRYSHNLVVYASLKDDSGTTSND